MKKDIRGYQIYCCSCTAFLLEISACCYQSISQICLAFNQGFQSQLNFKPSQLDSDNQKYNE